jgi:hypothetical protein
MLIVVLDDRLVLVGTIPTRRRGTTLSWHEVTSLSGTPMRNVFSTTIQGALDDGQETVTCRGNIFRAVTDPYYLRGYD